MMSIWYDWFSRQQTDEMSLISHWFHSIWTNSGTKLCKCNVIFLHEQWFIRTNVWNYSFISTFDYRIWRILFDVNQYYKTNYLKLNAYSCHCKDISHHGSEIDLPLQKFPGFLFAVISSFNNIKWMLRNTFNLQKFNNYNFQSGIPLKTDKKAQLTT